MGYLEVRNRIIARERVPTAEVFAALVEFDSVPLEPGKEWTQTEVSKYFYRALRKAGYDVRRCHPDPDDRLTPMFG